MKFDYGRVILYNLYSVHNLNAVFESVQQVGRRVYIIRVCVWGGGKRMKRRAARYEIFEAETSLRNVKKRVLRSSSACVHGSFVARVNHTPTALVLVAAERRRPVFDVCER